MICSTAGMTKKRADKTWTPPEKWRLLNTAESLSGDEVGEFLGQEGIYESQLQLCRSEILEFLRDAKREKALAEAAASSREWSRISEEPGTASQRTRTNNDYQAY